jgi:hypothetical protein
MSFLCGVFLRKMPYFVHIIIYHRKEKSNRSHVITPQTQYRQLETNISRKGTALPSPNSYIHVSVSNLYIPTIGLPILLQENMWSRGPMVRIYRSLTEA